MIGPSLTFSDAVIQALERAGAYNSEDQVRPAGILWSDKERQWEPLLPELRKRLPLLTLGPYSPAERTGPAYYLRCMVARTLPDALPPDATPIIYLPGVSRQELRAIEECPKHLQPLAELQYRGVLWTHKNGRDWTVAGFVQNADDGLGIAVGADSATREALLRALPVLARQPVGYLRKEAPLRAPFFDALLNPDEVRRLLSWMNDPQGVPAQVSPVEWAAFCNLCNRKYGFHPQYDGELAAGERLGQPVGEWEIVWQRFLEAPAAYPNLPELLRQARPQQLALLEPGPYWPQDNETAEANLRDDLLALKEQLPADARNAVYALDQKHGVRRSWVWARLDQASLAVALEHLVRLARVTETALGGATVSAIAEDYTGWGWQADGTVLDALATVSTAEDVEAIKAAILPLYRPWLEVAAAAFQSAVMGNPAANYVACGLDAVEAGACIVFSDALRFDASQRLVMTLERRGFDCESRWRLDALPTVTSTAKPATSPVADQVTGGDLPGLAPVVKTTGTPLSAETFRKLLQGAGYQVLGGAELGDPAGKAWTEIGAIDQYGHGHGWKIAQHIGDELKALEGRIAELLGHGWKQVIVITDHGWLMLPGGLPKAELPVHLTELRKGRCAVMKEGADTDQSLVPWYWDPKVCIAVAPGIACYEAGKEYEHGGLSPQECVVPVIAVTLQGGAEPAPVGIKQIAWKRLRCNIEITGAAPGMTVDIRTKAADPGTSLAQAPKAPNPDGAVSLPVPDDERIGEAAFVVVLAEDGTVRAQALTTIGG
jgi:hypothetical protein